MRNTYLEYAHTTGHHLSNSIDNTIQNFQVLAVRIWNFLHIQVVESTSVPLDDKARTPTCQTTYILSENSQSEKRLKVMASRTCAYITAETTQESVTPPTLSFGIYREALHVLVTTARCYHHYRCSLWLRSLNQVDSWLDP